MFLFKQAYYRKQSDETLLDQIRNGGDSRCLGELYVRYGHLVFGVCLKYLKNQMDAEDLTSEIFERLSQKIRNHDIANFKSWLYSVTKNECFMRLRKKSIQTNELNDELFGETPDNKEELETKESQFELLETALDELKAEQHDCIRLFYIEKKSYDQISQELRISVKQVKSAIQNGKRNLKIRMDQTYESEK